VTPLFELDSLMVTKTRGLDLTNDVHCVVLDADGALAATVRDRASVARTFARALGTLSRRSTYEWDVLDPKGNRLLDVVKPKQRLRGASPTVSLVDGTMVGRAVTRGYGTFRPIDLEGPGGGPLGHLEPALGQGARQLGRVLFYRVHEAEGVVAGEILHHTRDPWGFELAFHAEADFTTRALSLAVAVCLMQERLVGASG